MKKILIAEDNASNFMLLNVILSKKYNIVHAWNGKEAVDMYTAEHPDLILMDITMPVMDGYEATKEIRKLTQDVPIIGLTARAYADDEEEGMECGMTLYMTKPINMPMLHAKLSELIGE